MNNTEKPCIICLAVVFMDYLKSGWKFKGTHTVYFSSSLYIINLKSMIHKTDFHCIATWVGRSSG